jgi:hypothetical protein
MILFPAMIVGGHLMFTVVDNVPNLNFEPICRDAAAGNTGLKIEFETCSKDESEARDQLAKEWSGFDAADRARCVRLSTTNRTASYVEVLTCLELERDVKKMRRATDAAPDLIEQAPGPARERAPAPVRNVAQARHPDPVSLAPPEPPPAAASGLLQVFCLPGLKAILPACNSSQ